MITPRRALVPIVLVALTVWLASAGGAHGQTPPAPGQSAPTRPDRPEHSVEINVDAGPDGVTIYISTLEVTPGSDGSDGTEGTDGRDGGPAAPSCTARPLNIGIASVGWVRQGLEAHPGTVPWATSCDNGYFGIAWVPVDAPAAPNVVVGEPPIPPVDPAVVRASVFGIVPLPPIGIGANPEVGLVALPAWFWVRGYDGATLRGSESLGRSTVEVEITPAGYRWSFGDGAALETHSLGRAYPAESDLRHAYEQSSLGAGGTFAVVLEITFSARYRENGGPWLPLTPIVKSYTRAYAVQQLQSVLTRDR